MGMARLSLFNPLKCSDVSYIVVAAVHAPVAVFTLVLFLTFTSQYRVVSNNFYTVIEDLTLATHLDYLDCSSSRFMDVFTAVLYLHSNNGFVRAADFDP